MYVCVGVMDASRLKTFILPLGGAVLLSGAVGAVYYYLTKNVSGSCVCDSDASCRYKAE